ncbi:hypothetical protein SAMN06273567_105234 [Geodermatophilus aquaeductus]|uniref:Swt1-like HEPN domain-containing protein n=2 Tax=Geodermatophilus aquaeductus TaxID=1564161 RepID=A0A521EL52_9ACTN|nr:hypothetical protein SAMN06273567_105234 [Geodermatophilus aquaeductus]
MPRRSLELYARWWQLETWLRDLAYVELRALRGVSWIDALKTATGRQAQDAAFTHMSSADTDNPLAYLDYRQLVSLIDDHWDQCGYALIERQAWAGRQIELARIRHRIGHVRSAHRDDLGRLEQTLRDLERGRFISYASYNRRQVPDPSEHADPVTTGWVRRRHPTAQRLIAHAQRQYETRLRIGISKRPCARWPQDLADAPGLLWHADFYMRERTIDLRRLWHDSAVADIQPLLVHLLADNPWHVGFTFTAVDDAQAVSDAVGAAFDAVLLCSGVGLRDDDQWTRWRHRASDLDYRVAAAGPWTTIDENTVPVSLFGAGGEVESTPPW